MYATRAAGVPARVVTGFQGGDPQLQDGDLIVLTIGEPIGTSGGTNTMKIVRVGETYKD